MAPVRILTVGNLYPPHHFGGYEQVWQSAVAHLRDAGHDVEVLAVQDRLPGVADGQEPGVHRLLHWYSRDHGFPRVGLRRRVRVERHNHAVLRRVLHDLRPHAVAFWSMGGMSHSLIEAVRRRGLPVVLLVHDAWFDYGRFTDQWLRLFYPRWARPAGRLAQAVLRLPVAVDYGRAGRWVFVSEHLRQHALRVRPELGDTAVAPSGIHPSFAGAEPPPAAPWAWRLLHVGRLHPDKGIHDAVEALAALPAEATLTFAGTWDPREEAALADRVRALGLAGRVTMLGHVGRDEVAALHRRHDALLFCVRWEEPWGLVPLEAMGSGLPVVATGLGGSGEYLRDAQNALLVPPADPGAIATAVRRLADDPALRARLRAGGLRTAPRHTEPVFNAEVERHLLEVVA